MTRCDTRSSLIGGYALQLQVDGKELYWPGLQVTEFPPAIQKETDEFIGKFKCPPKVVLLFNPREDLNKFQVVKRRWVFICSPIYTVFFPVPCVSSYNVSIVFPKSNFMVVDWWNLFSAC